MQMAQLEEEYDAYVDDMLEQGLEPMSMRQFLEQIAAEAQMSSNEEGIGSLDAGAPDITYEGNEGPKSPQQMAFDDTPGFEIESLKELMDEFYIDNGREPLSIDELRRHFYIKYGKDRISKIDEIISNKQMASGPVLPSPEDPINPFTPKPTGPDLPEKMMAAKGGRIGYKGGANRVSELLITRAGILAKDANADVSDIDAEIFQLTGKVFKSVGGIGDVPTGKMRKNNAGVIERDYRDKGGFVPVGIKERADDVPAMLSKNEFVMTADAVRGIGNGSVEEGSKKLYNTMKQAEKVGKA